MIAILAFVFSTASLQADQELQFCEEVGGIDSYYCLGAARAAPLITKAVQQNDIESTPFKDVSELAANLNLKESVPALLARLRSASGLPHNYDSGNPLTRQDLHYAALAVLALEGNKSADAVIAYLRSLGEYEFTGSAWGDSTAALAKVGSPQSASYAQAIIEKCRVTKDECANLLPVALDLAISARAVHLIPAFRQIPVTNPEQFTSNEQSTIEGKRMVLGDRELRKQFRDALLPRVRYWRQNGGGMAFPVANPDRYLEGARDSQDMEIHASIVLGPYLEEATASFESMLYFLDHPAEYPDYSAVRADLFQRIKRDAGILPIELENESLPQTFDSFMRETGAGRDLPYRQVLLRYGDRAAGGEILAIFEKYKSQPDFTASWLSAETALLESLNPSPDSILHLIRLENQGKGDQKTLQYRLDFLDAAAAKMSRPVWVAAMLDSNVFVRDRVLFHLSRRKPAEYCALIEQELKTFETESGNIVRDALFAMTLYGSDCVPVLLRLADSRLPLVRGTAVEALTALRHGDAASLRKRKPANDIEKARYESAENIAKF